MNFFLICIFRLVLVHKNGNRSQKSWKLILRTFILQASCACGVKVSISLSDVSNVHCTKRETDWEKNEDRDGFQMKMK